MRSLCCVLPHLHLHWAACTACNVLWCQLYFSGLCSLILPCGHRVGSRGVPHWMLHWCWQFMSLLACVPPVRALGCDDQQVHAWTPLGHSPLSCHTVFVRASSRTPMAARATTKQQRQRNRPPSRFRTGQVSASLWRPDDPELGRQLEAAASTSAPQMEPGLPMHPSRLATLSVESAIDDDAAVQGSGSGSGPRSDQATGLRELPPRPPPPKRLRHQPPALRGHSADSPELVQDIGDHCGNSTIQTRHTGRRHWIQHADSSSSPELIPTPRGPRQQVTDPGSLNVNRPRVSTIGTAQITQQATAEEMVDSAGHLDALPTQPSAQDASDGDSSESSDGSMSSQRADKSRLAYLRRCADYLQVQNRRYLRRQRRQKSLSVLVLPTTMYGSFCVVVLILWRLTSLPAWNGCSGCAQQSIGLAVSCTAWVLTQVLSVRKQSVLATFDRSQPGPKSGRSHCSMSKGY